MLGVPFLGVLLEKVCVRDNSRILQMGMGVNEVYIYIIIQSTLYGEGVVVLTPSASSFTLR